MAEGAESGGEHRRARDRHPDLRRFGLLGDINDENGRTNLLTGRKRPSAGWRRTAHRSWKHRATCAASRESGARPGPSHSCARRARTNSSRPEPRSRATGGLSCPSRGGRGQVHVSRVPGRYVSRFGTRARAARQCPGATGGVTPCSGVHRNRWFGCGLKPVGASTTQEARPAVQLVRMGCTWRCGMPPNSTFR